MECGSRCPGRSGCGGGVEGRLQVKQELAVRGVVGVGARAGGLGGSKDLSAPPSAGGGPWSTRSPG